MNIEKLFNKEVMSLETYIMFRLKEETARLKEELISKCEVLKNTKAYREDSIYCTNSNIYLSVMSLPEIVTELNELFLNNETGEYFYKIR